MAIRRDLEILAVGALAGLGLASSLGPNYAAAVPPVPQPAEQARVAPRRPGQGHDAEVPSEITVRGWWQILKRVYAKFLDDRVMTEAAGVTFYTLLALFPALAALVSLYSLFADPVTISQTLNSVSGVVPGGGLDILSQQLHALTSKQNSTLGIGLIVGLLTSLWSANSGVKSMFDALNIVYEEREKRGYVHRTILSFAFTLGAILFLMLALAGTVVVPAVLGAVGLGGTTGALLEFGRWPVLLLVVAGFLAVLYRFGPSREHARWEWVNWGSAFAAVLWVCASLLFSLYVGSFGSYNKTYGALGAVVGFMTWIWISSMVVLIGGLLNAEMEHQTARDTTNTGRPLGQRGAVKADTVAA
jgi:membrane protein